MGKIDPPPAPRATEPQTATPRSIWDHPLGVVLGGVVLLGAGFVAGRNSRPAATVPQPSERVIVYEKPGPAQAPLPARVEASASPAIAPAAPMQNASAQVVAQAMPAAVPPPTPTVVPTPAPKEWRIVGVDAKVTESNDSWWRYAWKLTLANDSSVPLVFEATIEFQDAEGFVIDTAREYRLTVGPYLQDTFTGSALIRVPGAERVARTNAKVGIRK
jgi:hypothetical protein